MYTHSFKISKNIFLIVPTLLTSSQAPITKDINIYYSNTSSNFVWLLMSESVDNNWIRNNRFPILHSTATNDKTAPKQSSAAQFNTVLLAVFCSIRFSLLSLFSLFLLLLAGGSDGGLPSSSESSSTTLSEWESNEGRDSFWLFRCTRMILGPPVSFKDEQDDISWGVVIGSEAMLMQIK